MSRLAASPLVPRPDVDADRPRRVLMLSDVYFPRVNGVSTSTRTFRDELRALGHEVVLVAPAYGLGEPDEAGVVRVPCRPVPFDPEDRLVLPRRVLAAATRLPGSWDVVHVQTPFAAHLAGVRFARAYRLPLVETYHTDFEHYLGHYVPFLPDRLLAAVARRVARRQCDAVDRLVVPSRPMAEVLRGYGITTPLEVLPTGLVPGELGEGDPAALRARLGIAPDRPVVVHVGRVALEKNISFLLRVVERVRASLPNLLFVIAGEGPGKPSLEAEVRRLGLEGNVRFLGNFDRQRELASCYRLARAFVFASRTETQGLVLLEAMSLGVPVVSTAVLGTRDVVEGCPAALVAPEDVATFASAVRLVIGDDELHRRLAEAGPAVAARWSAGTMARRLAGIYDDAIADFAGRREAAAPGRRPETGAVAAAACRPLNS